MQIETKFHGEMEVSKSDLWQFPKGMPGFEEEKEFVLLSIEGNAVFRVLQSVQTPNVAFIVGNPYTFTEDYSFKIDEPTVELLKIEKPEDIFVLGIISLKDPFEASTINLQAPVIFHAENKTAKQMIVNDESFSLRHPIGESQSSAKEEA
ncbi:flagellar assembly protein FliW [Sporosarcina pasteurii]|uniref:Flagellar assembly factor FliW n=1 Tax=Sporosarcina pasteurii TaxID=1474 RepID=A0A380BDT1_SPOPA|nr:flagellar assembly protein FliW [Sporosarcina pasteurii]MDS9470328.1 flagellar assembly protein FliW [Sporosarcina pasteurii]QBQ05959.1 flagellar assembly protein FliW [Sporosarcina pasteurii]SUI99820.1 Flagellar assembly factor FliW [Sporosarcina pasteurii]